jgi:hypothetical protein
MNWIKDNWFKLSIITVVTIIGFCIGFYFLKVLPDTKKQALSIEQQKVENQRIKDQEEADRKAQSDRELYLKQLQAQSDQESCLNNAEEAYSENWDNQCTINGVNSKGPNCSLPTSSSSRLENLLKEAKDLCIKRFPTN